MRRLLVITSVILLSHHAMMAQIFTGTESVMRFLGSDDLQELDADEVEKLEHLIDDPARINILSEQELRSCGIFTPYQSAVIRDYIDRHGPIRSLLELSMLDGLGETFVKKAAPFINLSVQDMGSSKMLHEIAARSGFKWQAAEGWNGNYAIKYRIRAGGRLAGTVAASRPYGSSSWAPSAFSGCLAWKSARMPLRVLAGDFNARFGQGLTLWSNSFLTTLTTPDSFMKRPSGITQPWSFTGGSALTGVAAEVGFGRWQFSAMTAFPGLKEAGFGKLQFMPAINLAWYGRNGQVSITNILSAPLARSSSQTTLKTGVDAAFCIRGVNIFGEMSYDWIAAAPSMLAGTRFRFGESSDMAVQARVFINDQYGVACSGMHSFSTSAVFWVVDYTNNINGHQIKSRITYEKDFGDEWKLKVRVTERFRTWGLPFRTDARADVTYARGGWTASMRLNVLDCDKTGVLSYAEAGRKSEKLTAYLRQGIFFIDDWDDRIYVYERDAPGAFNVPAMYGRGLWTSMTASARLSPDLRLYARTSYVCYPFMEKKKPGKAELKLQLQWRF